MKTAAAIMGWMIIIWYLISLNENFGRMYEMYRANLQRGYGSSPEQATPPEGYDPISRTRFARLHNEHHAQTLSEMLHSVMPEGAKTPEKEPPPLIREKKKGR